MQFMSAAFGELEGLSLFEIPDSAKQEKSMVRSISASINAPIVVAGHRTLAPLRRAFPELPLNSLFNLSVGVSPTDLVSGDLRDRLTKLSQCEVPDVPFAFVDHHPGTPREIPRGILAGIESRGLLVIQNPLGTPLAELVSLLDAAEELHLVASAPLCLALTLDARAKSRTHYDSLGDPISKGYSRWESVKIVEGPIKRPSKLWAQDTANFRLWVTRLYLESGRPQA
jgi:hypothetical protein